MKHWSQVPYPDCWEPMVTNFGNNVEKVVRDLREQQAFNGDVRYRRASMWDQRRNACLRPSPATNSGAEMNAERREVRRPVLVVR